MTGPRKMVTVGREDRGRLGIFRREPLGADRTVKSKRKKV